MGNGGGGPFKELYDDKFGRENPKSKEVHIFSSICVNNGIKRTLVEDCRDLVDSNFRHLLL